MTTNINRRSFLKTSSVAAIGAGAVLTTSTANAHHNTTAATALAKTLNAATPTSVGDNIYLSAKWGMVGIKGSILEKFEAMKRIGYDGIELGSPTGDKKKIQEFVNASKKSGMPIHGTVNSLHWQKKHSVAAKNKDDRAQSIKTIKQCIEDTRAVGGDAMLLVVGVQGRDGNQQDVWKRSVDSIRQCIPTATKNGVRILFENVWNNFCQTPELMRAFIDTFESPWVGSYFDIGNHISYRPSEDWIRVLRHRIVKLDGKDFNTGAKNPWSKIGEGKGNWPEIRKALAEINFSGWCTAEVGGGDEKRLTEVYNNMDKHIRGH